MSLDDLSVVQPVVGRNISHPGKRLVYNSQPTFLISNKQNRRGRHGAMQSDRVDIETTILELNLAEVRTK